MPSRCRQKTRRPLPFSPGIDTGDRLYLAGVVGQGNGATEEARAALAGIRSTLEVASKDFGDVESVWVYLADVRDWEAVKAVLDEIMGGNMTVPTVVGTRLMGRSGVEIQMIAGG